MSLGKTAFKHVMVLYHPVVIFNLFNFCMHVSEVLVTQSEYSHVVLNLSKGTKIRMNVKPLKLLLFKLPSHLQHVSTELFFFRALPWSS